jgi:hypothetical protein
MLCVGVLGAGGVAYFYLQRSSTPFPPEVVSTVPPPSIEQPGPTDLPVIPEPTSSGTSLTGNQQLEEFRLYDDFSSDALGWPVYDDGKTILKYEDGQYSFQIAEPDYFDWAYVPVDFSPTDISFDVKSDADPQNGTFGVFCQFQDENNYFYVEFDLSEASYMVGQYFNGEDIVLTPQNAQGQYWQETSTLYSAPGALNRITISCNRNFITLFINDEWITDVNPPKPVENPGEMAFFVYTFPSADSDGFKVYFDNVEVYKPVQ